MTEPQVRLLAHLARIPQWIATSDLTGFNPDDIEAMERAALISVAHNREFFLTSSGRAALESK